MKRISHVFVILALVLAWSTAAMAQPEKLEWNQEDGQWVGSMVWKTDVSKGGSLDIRNMIGSVEVIGEDVKKATIEIEFYAEYDLDREEAEELAEEQFPNLREAKGRLYIRMPKRSGWVRHWDDHNDYSYRIVAHVPKEFDVSSESDAGSSMARYLTGNVDLSTGGGAIEVLDCSGDIGLSTGGGSIDVENVKGELSASTGGGGITITSAVSERRSRVSTGGGGIRLSDSKGEFSVSTGAGNVDVRDHEGPLKVTTGAGSLDIRNFGGEIYASTGIGSIDFEINPESKLTGEVELHTGMGSVDVIVPKNVGADVRAEVRDSRSERKIRSDYDLDVDVSHRGTFASGEINGGGVPLRIETSNGKISIRER